MRLAIPSAIALTIVTALAFAHIWLHEPKGITPTPVHIEALTDIIEAPIVEAPAPVEAKPEPFAYPEAVMPSPVPLPKPRPRRRHAKD